MPEKTDILFIETFYGGSHRLFTDSLIRHSQHHFDLITLPDRCWKWRIRSSVWNVIEQMKNLIGENKKGLNRWDLIVLSEMIDLPFLKEELRRNFCSSNEKLPPIICYFHENTLTYPNPESRIDYQLSFSPVLNALTADWSLFNSEYHRQAFAREAAKWVERIPEFGPEPAVIREQILNTSSVLYPGICDDFENAAAERAPATDKVRTILWNHRWEFDKKPESFFSVLKEMKAAGHPFRLILAGENSQLVPKPFLEAKDYFTDEIIHYGYLESRNDYINLLKQADISISTSIQENFGISFIEAALSGAIPMLPDRLSYPELIPENYKEVIIYKNRKELSAHLSSWLSGDPLPDREELIRHLKQHCWKNRISEYDNFFDHFKERT